MSKPTAADYNKKSDLVMGYINEHPHEELTNKTLADALDLNTKDISNAIFSLRTYRKLPIVSVKRGVYMYKPEGIVSAQRVEERREAKQEATRQTVEGQAETLAGKVLDFLKANPNTPLGTQVIGDATGLPAKQITGAILTLQRKSEPVTNDMGIYTFVPGGPIDQKKVDYAKSLQENKKTGRKPGRPSKVQSKSVTTKQERFAIKLHRRAVVLYELMDAAPKHPNGSFATSILELVAASPKARKEFIFGGKFAPGGVYKAHTHLLEIGSIRTEGPTYRYLIAHPDDVRPNMASGIRGDFAPEEATTVVFDSGTKQPATSAPKSQSKSEKAADAIDSVSSEDLAAAVAEAMWQRYEMAITEIGRLRELLSFRDQEIARLSALVDEMPPGTASDFARRMLGKR